jgi:hypothetical protein
LRIEEGLRARIGALARHPLLLIEAVRLLGAVRRRRGLTPSVVYLDWRAITAYGSAAPFSTADLLGFLDWRRRMRSLAGRGEPLVMAEQG